MSADAIVQELTDALAADGLELPPSAAMLVEAYAAQVARMRDARARIAEEGEIVPGPRDQPVPHPALAIERAATAEVGRLHAALMKEARRHQTRRGWA